MFGLVRYFLKITFISVFALSGCAYEAPRKTESIANLSTTPPPVQFIKILGSNSGNYADKIEVIRDIKVSGLRIRQVRQKELICKSGYVDRLELDGEIGPDSTFIIDKTLSELTQCININDGIPHRTAVYLNSDGGRLDDGIKLGLIFRKKGVTTLVIDGQTCASSCAIAFLGGQGRKLLASGALVFHSPYQNGQIDIICASKSDVADLKKYFEDMLLGKDRDKSKGQILFDRAMSYCSSTKGWAINGDAASIYGITTN